MILKQKEIFNKVANERVEEITELYKKVNSDDAICRFKGQTPDGKFDGYDNPFDLLDKIREGRIKLSNARNDQIKFTSDQAEIKKKKQKEIKRAKKKLTIQNWNALQSKKQGYLIFWWLFFNCIWS